MHSGVQPHPRIAVGKLGRLSALMCFALAIGGAFVQLALAWIWFSPDLVRAMVVPQLGLSGAPLELTASTRLMGFAISMIPAAVLFYLLHQAFQLFDQYRLGNIFSADAPARLRGIGQSMLVLAILRPVTGTLLTLVLTAANPPGQRYIAVSIGLDDYLIAAFGGLVLAIGLVMSEATRIAEEHRQFV